MKRLYALLVGICDYRPQQVLGGMAAFPALSGCTDDARDLLHFLQLDPDWAVHPLLLTDAQATKQGIANAITQHLGQAGTDDLVLFYFSGHGAVELADERVWQEKRLQGIVAFTDHADPGKVMLADKELRFLFTRLYEKTGAHILTIFDCCHAGDNLRAAAAADWTAKQIAVEFPVRPWQDFLFHPHFQPADFYQKGIDQVMPPGRYVQLAACAPDEIAKESLIQGRKRGVFTWYLLQSLQQAGSVATYADLIHRVRTQLQFSFTQTPQHDVPRQHADLAQSGFLGKPAGALARACSLEYNAAAGVYFIDRGYFHHVLKDVTLVKVRHGNTECWGRVSQVSAHTALVAFTAEALAGLPRTALPATLHQVVQRALRLYVHQVDAALQHFDPLLARLGNKDTSACIQWDSEGAAAEYWIVMRHFGAYIAFKNDPARPLLAPVFWKNADAAETLAAYIRHIAQWHFTLHLSNNGQQNAILPAHFIQIQAFQLQNGQWAPLAPGADGLQPVLEKQAHGGQAVLKIRLKNSSTQPLQIAALYLSRRFGCDTLHLLGPSRTLPFAPGEEKWLAQDAGAELPFEMEPEIVHFNTPAYCDFLKIIFANTPLRTDMFELAELPGPLETTPKITDSEDDTTRGRVPEDWNTLVMPLVFKNPDFDPQRPEVLPEW
jgi:hypothetical protein